jgi:hypothetical protein
VPLGLAKACTQVVGRPCRTWSTMLYRTAVDIDATCGNRASEAKYPAVPFESKGE